MNNEGRACGIGILIGLGIGLAVAYLTAPRTGTETRELLRDKMTELKTKAQETFSSMKKAVPRGDGAGEE